ncbi:hypothetical protein THTE_2703 [Thermogutta terrifontis]|uniref:Uncharacterized protein n=1 Tax=Thermogutta terrifontis TaxID=1331910 RepID=A0A286RH56_9BACT|nr:hypothetical protein THTE_2703 [Thermogutta terrifontis]
MVCGESSLGYTVPRELLWSHRLWFAGNRRSDTLGRMLPYDESVLWFAGNRRSDTLQ